VRRTTLLVAVPEAEPVTSHWWPSWDPPMARGIPAHVTILFPFLPARDVSGNVLDAVGAAVAEVSAAPVTFRHVARFPRTVYLAPEPAAPFAELVARIVARFPGLAPYGGAHDRVVPHLTVVTTADEAVLDRAAGEVVAALPLRTSLREVLLMEEMEHGGWRQRAAFPLRARARRVSGG
jgi:2'-5' RNA ligase